MKRFCIAFAALTLLFAFTGCSNGGGPGGGTLTDNPDIKGISYGTTPTVVTKDGTINFAYDQEETFTATVENASTYSWTAAPAGVVTITNPDKLTAKIKGTKVEGGETEITFEASNGDLKDTFKFKIKVAPRPSEGLFLVVKDGEEDQVSNDDQFDMFTTDTSGLTFTAEALEDATNVSSTVTWAITAGGEDFVALSTSTGTPVTITPKAIGTATITAKVTSAKDGPEYVDKTVVFKVNVSKGWANILFEWSHADNPITGTTFNSNSGNSWTHPGNANFMKQKDDMVVKTFRNYGGGIPTTENNKGLGLGGHAANARLAIGNGLNVATAAHTADTIPIPDFGGEIDLYRKKVRLTVDYADASITENAPYLLRVLIGNNGTGEAHSIFGAASNVWTGSIGAGVSGDRVDIAGLPGNTEAAGRIVLDIDTTKDDGQIGKGLFGHINEAYLAKTFIALHCQHGTTDPVQQSKITITGIKLEYLEGTATPGTLVLTIKDGESKVIDSTVELDIEKAPTSIDLNAELNETGADITWSANSANVTLSGTTGSNVTITAAAKGSANVTVIARKAGFILARKVIEVTVDGEGGPPPPPTGTIWEWDSGAVGWTWTSIAANANGTLTPGLGAKPNIKVRNWGGIALNSHTADTRKGIVMGTTGAHRFLIGSNSNANSDTTPFYDATAEFDFSTATLKGQHVKITVKYDVLSRGTGTEANHQLRILINNNTVNTAGSFLRFNGNWYLAQNSIWDGGTTSTNLEANLTVNKGPFTLEGIVDPSKITASTTLPTDVTVEQMLANSYIAIGMMANTGTVLIHSIKIEYVTPQ